MTKPKKTIRILEKRGPILWEDPWYEAGQWWTRGWAVCPCCDKRELEVLASGKWPK